MSYLRFRPWTAALSTALVLSSVSHADAQLFANRMMGNSCDCGPVQSVQYVQPQMAYDPCNVCNQQQVVYRQVPVTEYKQVTQRVRKPIVETAYEDRQFTEYKTVYETRTAEIPTVSYQNVTEYQTVQRDMGRWVSYQQPVQKVSPCAYDNSAGLLGMLNRTRHAFRNMVTPNAITRRQYCPNVVAQQVPVTRQVAIRGTKQVSYQVARVVPETTTRRVAVRKVRWQDEEVVAQVPVTSYRTVPIGTQTAFGFVPFDDANSSVTAQAPSPDPISTRSAEGPTPVDRTAEKPNNSSETRRDGNSGNNQNNGTKTQSNNDDNNGGFNPFGTGTQNDHPQNNNVQPVVQRQEVVTTNHSPASPAKPAVPSMIRSGWRARTSASEPSSLPPGTSSDGPSLHVVKTTN